MAKYYDYGIDLGTTNSCVAKQSNSDIIVYQNLDNMNVTPSAIYMGKNGRMLVGRRAYDKVISEPENTAIEFKRLMGVKTSKHFELAEKEMTPVELSAEVLKSLRDDVYRNTNTYLNHAIITVPAAFGTIQCEDTYKAAEIAGFKSVVLLQEPIAAGIAYGAKLDSKDQYWLVFDFGGGTLDIAIISTFDGRLTVVNHEGDNYLGGKNIDEAIYKDVIEPVIEAKFELPNDSAKMEFIHRKLLIVAEDAKKALSTSNTTTMDIFDIGDDENGEPIECRIELTKNKFDEIIKPIIDKCIALCDKAIAESKITKEQIAKILLVGGTTLVPAIREALKSYYNIELDTSIDPMTVVARGAAIYGSSYKVPHEETEATVTENDITVVMEYAPATSEDTANIIGRFSSTNETITYAQIKIDETSGIWTSGWMDVLDEEQGLFDVDVMLQKNTINNFKLSVRDTNGVMLNILDSEFQIKHQDNVLITSAPPIPHSLCVEITADGKRKLEKMLIKGTTLPAKTMRNFKANKTIKPNSEDFIAIKIWEGENVDNPEDNQWVGNIYIRSESINRPIPEGFDIEVGITIDESRKISVTAYVPHLDLEISDNLVYNSEQLDLQKPMQLLENDIRVLYNEIDNIIEEADLNDIIERAEQYATDLHDIDLEYMECNKLIGLDDDRVVRLLKKFHSLKAQVSELRYLLNESTKESTELDEIVNMEETIKKFGDEDDMLEFKELSENYKKIDSDARSKGKQHYKEKMSELQARVMFNNPDIIKYFLIELCNPTKVYHDERQALHWKEKGLIAIKNDDMFGMKEALRNLMKLSGQDTFSTLSERELPPDLR